MVAPLIAAAGISAAASLIGGITGGKGAKKSAKIAAQSAAADRAQALQIYNTNMGMAQPAIERGNRAGAQIDALLGLGGDAGTAKDALATFRAGTGYQDRLDQGMRAINTGYAARGALESGAAQRSLAKYGAGLAGESYGQYVDALRGQVAAGAGALGAATGAGNAYQAASMAANNNASSAQANAALYGAQATQNALSGVAGAAGSYFGGLDWDRRMGSSYGARAYQPPIYSTPGYGGGSGMLRAPIAPSINVFGGRNPFG